MQNKSTLIISGVIVAVVLSLAVWQLTQTEKDTQDTDLTAGQASDIVIVDDSDSNDSDDADADTDSAYANGVYEATGAYVSPAGAEEISIELTLADGIVTAASFEGRATHPTSQKLQDMFDEGFEEAVIGRSIEGLSLGVVNGSSLTPKGFNDAVVKIQEEAQ